MYVDVPDRCEQSSPDSNNFEHIKGNSQVSSARPNSEILTRWTILDEKIDWKKLGACTMTSIVDVMEGRLEEVGKVLQRDRGDTENTTRNIDMVYEKEIHEEISVGKPWESGKTDEIVHEKQTSKKTRENSAKPKLLGKCEEINDWMYR